MFNHLRQNPHRLHLGQIGFEFVLGSDRSVTPADLQGVSQKLDFWTGLLDSRFEVEGQPVRVLTVAHPELDMIAVRVESPLVSAGKLRVMLTFPYGSPEVPMANWNMEKQHLSVLQIKGHRALIQRQVDATRYEVGVEWSNGGALEQAGTHAFRLGGTRDELEFVCAFSPRGVPGKLPGFSKTVEKSATHWREFWSRGGAIDLSGSTDPRAEALEHRTVLSLYQTAIHCAGSLPSAETGLLFNSWYGKFHLEMHWWHSVHFAAWNRFPLFERSLGFMSASCRWREIWRGLRAIAARAGRR